MANYLDPYASELQGIQRQQELAKMLMQQGQQQPQEQMVSGRVAPINPLQAFLPALNTYQGMNLAKNAESETKKLADLVRGERQKELKNISSLIFGSEDYKPAINSDSMDADGNVISSVTPQVGTAPNLRKAFETSYTSDNPQANALASALYGRLTKQPEIVKTNQGESIGQFENGVYKPIYTNPAKKEKPPVSYQEYQLAKEEGFNGSYNDYQTLEANRRRPITNINTGASVGAEGEGGFDKKGNFISPNGTPHYPSELKKDREVLTSAALLKKALNNINPTDVQATDTLLGDVTQGGVKGFLAKQVLPKGAETLSAQNKINASGVMQILNNLPPGPASDNDVKQARSTFPGYGNAKALQDWIDNTNAMLDQKFATYQDKYGSMKWYGNTNPMQSRTGATGDFSGDGFTIKEKK